jgi:hypothetical protein
MKLYARCINPTKLLNHRQVYLVECLRGKGTSHGRFSNSDWINATHLKVCNIHNRRAYPLIVRADRFQSINPNTIMKNSEIPPVYNIINHSYPEENAIGLTENELLDRLNYGDTFTTIDEITGNDLIITKTSVKNGKIVTESFNQQLSLQFTIN